MLSAKPTRLAAQPYCRPMASDGPLSSPPPWPQCVSRQDPSAGAGLAPPRASRTIHPHQLRHNLATQAINRGMSLEAIAALLVEQLGVVDDDAVEHPVEFLCVDPVGPHAT